MVSKEGQDGHARPGGLIGAVFRQVYQAVGAGEAIDTVRVLPTLWLHLPAVHACTEQAALKVAPSGRFAQRGGEGGSERERHWHGVCARQLPQCGADNAAETDETGYGVAGQAEVGSSVDVAINEGFARLHFDFIAGDGAKAFNGGFEVVVVADGYAA